ncbi:unnamed protein product, partial [Brenthis ino]
MGLTSNTGLLASVSQKPSVKQKDADFGNLQLRCDVTPAPFMLRPYAGLYNPFSNACSVLCNHPADTTAKEFVKRAKDAWYLEGKGHYFQEDLSKFQDNNEKDKNRTPHDIVTEDMFRRYTETDSRPLTPAPTLASGKSRGSRRCLTPDQPHPRTTIVLDLRRSHSQETLYYHGYATSDMTAGHTASANDRSTLPSLNLSGSAHNRLVNGQCEQLPPLASPLVLSKRTVKEPISVRSIKKTKLLQIKKQNPKEKPNNKSFYINYKPKQVKRKPLKVIPIASRTCECTFMHVTRIVISYAPKSRKRGASKIASSTTSWGTSGQEKRMKLPNMKITKKLIKREKTLTYDNSDFFKKLENQLKALNLGKALKTKKGDAPSSQRSKGEKDDIDGSEHGGILDDNVGGEVRRRGKRRRKGRPGGSDRLTSAGLAAQAQQDPETQIAGIGTDSQNPSSRGSIAQTTEDDIVLPQIKAVAVRKTDSFLDDDILKYLHREVDEDAIETEFDTKRRYVLEEALRTRPERPHSQEMQSLLRELRVPAVSLGDWLHVPRVFSRQSAQFSLPIDSNALEALSPMQYAARFITIKKSKQLLYLTVLRKFRPKGYRMPLKDIHEGLILMMGGILTTEQSNQFETIMEWSEYKEDENIPDEIKLTLLDTGYRKHTPTEGGDGHEDTMRSIKYRTWCGLCAICERMYGRFPSREKDPPDGMELSDFTMIETRLAVLKVHCGLVEVLNTIRTR